MNNLAAASLLCCLCAAAGDEPPATCGYDHRQRRCTAAGHYGVMQCDGGRCYCAHPLSGDELAGTSVGGDVPLQCPECALDMAKSLKAGRRPPDCDFDTGHYRPVQCDRAQGVCLCVEPLTGAPLDGSPVAKSLGADQCGEPAVHKDSPKAEYAKDVVSCEHARAAATEAAENGEDADAVPTCSEAPRYYALKQLSTRGAATCVDVLTGKAPPQLRSEPTADLDTLQCPSCLTSKYNVYRYGAPPAGSFVPQCDRSGDFEPLQCQANAGQCWCVRPASGRERAGTRTDLAAGAELPLCPSGDDEDDDGGSTSRAACDRHIRPAVCQGAPLTKATVSFKWFAEAGRCKAYLYYECDGDESSTSGELLPAASKRECEALCLP